MYTVDLKFDHKGLEYKVISTFGNEYCVVVKQEDFDNGVFPIPLFLIPMKEGTLS